MSAKVEKMAPPVVAVAWLHEDGSRAITSAEKSAMLDQPGVAGKRIAAAYSRPLVEAPAARAIAFEVAPGVQVELARQKDGSELWAVRDQIGNCLSVSGDWLAEPAPSSRDDAFLRECRFATTSAAIEAARIARGGSAPSTARI